MSKQCTKCKEVKPLSEFSQSNPTKKDGYNSWCLQCYRDVSKKRRESVDGIYDSSKGQCLFHGRKPWKLGRTEFKIWYPKQPKFCAYCDLPESEIKNIDDTQLNRSKRLTIDCKDNSRGYDIDNIVLSCLRCNFMKNDFLGFDAMRDIGQRHVKLIWERILEYKL